jgi:hypothetical protein
MMGIVDRLYRLDRRAGLGGKRRRQDEERRDYLARLATRTVVAYVPIEVYEELVDLHDRVARLEAALGSATLD